MKKIKPILVLALIMMTAFSCKKSEKTAESITENTKIKTERIISLNGAITEIVAALGHEKDIVGTDVTSTYPETLKKMAKDLGHVRSISIESIMALQPNIILATDKDMSPELLEKIKKSGIKAAVFTQEFSPEGTKKLIEDVAKALNNTNYEVLQQKVDADKEKLKRFKTAPKVLFIYARGAGMLMVSGKNTPVEKVITLAGGQNAVTDFEDYKPLTPEALIKGNPDVILMFTSGLESVGGVDGALKIKGVDKTNAGKNKKIIAMDGALLSGFGPRLGEATTQLNALLAENAK
ncbi:hemin ABC transporter substrate-binding protein [Flavobacterium sp. NRK1]|uniref:heme/hemin ABC transporter substrate-binding protein n=1 Tax=Flavobacterium sp. NRK1 TaxID=2954929 RepID=UPI00209352C3|nr:ABC transporter substrate-binding protein [Flavobacterium sp. NRK1]MCO6147591.1 ABC transporter substrate-binding protein [Flavobacterium sp. NRK1]